jgi:uncharacterized protein
MRLAGGFVSAMVSLTLLGLAAPVAAQQGGAPVDPAKAATIRHLLDLTGAPRLAIQGMEAMVPAQRTANPNVPPAFWDAFLAHARREVNQLVDSMVPIYAARFTQQELEQIVRFYESPVGRHLNEVQPQILQESMQVGQRWGMQIGKQIGESLSRSGVKAGHPN